MYEIDSNRIIILTKMLVINQCFFANLIINLIKISRIDNTITKGMIPKIIRSLVKFSTKNGVNNAKITRTIKIMNMFFELVGFIF